jgi:hypothetical protein
MVQTREAAVAAATTPDLQQTSQLFRITRARGREPGAVDTPRREEVIVVVEFLAN